MAKKAEPIFPTFLAAGGYLATWGSLLAAAGGAPLPPWVPTAFSLDAAIGGAGSAVVHARRGETGQALGEGFVALSAGTLGAAATVPALTHLPAVPVIAGGMAGYGVALAVWIHEESNGEAWEIVRNSLTGILRRALPWVRERVVAGAKRRSAPAKGARVVFSSEIPDWLVEARKRGNRR